MKNTKKKLTLALGLLGGAILLSSCTASFCSSVDQAEILYPYDQGVTIYCSATDEIPTGYTKTQVFNNNTNIYSYVPLSWNTEHTSYTYAAKKASYLNSIISSAISSNYRVPTVDYFAAIDTKVLNAAVALAAQENNTTVEAFTATLTVNDVSQGNWCINPYIENDSVGEEGDHAIELSSGANSVLRKYGAVKFSGNDEENTLYGNLDSWNRELKNELGLAACPSTDFYSLYKTKMSSKVSSLRSCIATRDGTFGHYGVNSDWKVQITKKSWSYAWSRGFLEGLLVYPVSYLVDTIAYNMDPTLTGWSQLLALIIVTFIVRGAMLALTFKNTMSQQKMQALQPQLAKIQQKYPNSNTNQAEKQRLAQEQMALYKRNKINPLGSFVVLIFQFPVFICVWSALQGSAALSTGSFLNLSLSYTIKDTLFNFSQGWATNKYGWWTALILFLLMAGTQILSMLIPQWFNKKKTESIAKFTANPAAQQQGNQTKTFMIMMMGMTIVMGFFLPSAMGVYWFIGALISICQTIITQSVLKKKER